MKKRVVDGSSMNHMDMENMKRMMEIGNLIQKVDKGNRKYPITVNYASRQILAKTLLEMHKMISQEGYVPTNFVQFVEYVNQNRKSKSFKLSYDEIEFLKKIVILTIEQQREISLPWYRFITKIFIKLTIFQYRELLKGLKV